MWAKYVSPLSQTAKRHHGAPAACSRRSAEKCHPHNGLTFVLTWSLFYSIAPKLDELSSPPANSEGRGWKQSLRQGLLFLLSAWRISASPRASTSHPPLCFANRETWRHTETGGVYTRWHLASEAPGPLLHSQAHNFFLP